MLKPLLLSAIDEEHGGRLRSRVDDYLSELHGLLRVVPWRRARLLREVRDHLLESIDQERERGRAWWDAEEEAIARFGSPRQLVRGELREAGLLWLLVIGAAQALRLFPPPAPELALAADVSPAQMQFRDRVLTTDDADRELRVAVAAIAAGSRWLLLDGLLRPDAVLVGGFIASDHRMCPLAGAIWSLNGREPSSRLEIFEGLSVSGLAEASAGFHGAFDRWACIEPERVRTDPDGRIVLTSRGRDELIRVIEQGCARPQGPGGRQASR